MSHKKVPHLGFPFGQILRAKLEFKETDTRRNKYFIILGEDTEVKDILFFLTTSQIDKIPASLVYQSNVIHIKPGEVACFDLPTAIDCRMVHSRKKSWFREKVSKSLLGFHGLLPSEFQDKIKQIAFNSPFISQHHRDIIWGKT